MRRPIHLSVLLLSSLASWACQTSNPVLPPSGGPYPPSGTSGPPDAGVDAPGDGDSATNYIVQCQITRTEASGQLVRFVGEDFCRFSRSPTGYFSHTLVMGKTRFPGLGGTLIGTGTVA